MYFSLIYIYIHTYTRGGKEGGLFSSTLRLFILPYFHVLIFFFSRVLARFCLLACLLAAAPPPFFFSFFPFSFFPLKTTAPSRLTLFIIINPAGLRPRYPLSFVRWILVYAWMGGGGGGRGWGGTGLEQERGEEWVKGGVKGALDIFFSLSIIAAVMVWYR